MESNHTYYYASEETFAGPKAELDKIQSVNWGLISLSDSAGDVLEFEKSVRYSDNSLMLRFLCFDPQL